MPILACEEDLFPNDLLERERLGEERDHRWWALYTRSRCEKQLMRKLRAMKTAFYGPLLPKQLRSAGGRIRTSYVPLFSNYVFLYGDDASRHNAMTTNCVSRSIEVAEGDTLAYELRQLRRLIQSGVSLAAESGLQRGTRVRIRSGILKGQEGTVVNRRGKTRLMVSVDFLQQGASVLMEDFEVERII